MVNGALSGAASHPASPAVELADGGGIAANTGRPQGIQVWNAGPAESVLDIDYGDPAEPLRPVRIKIPLTLTLLLMEIIIFVWRIKVPTVFDTINIAAIVYLLLILSFVPIISIIGWYGASMTFPIEKE